jgi:membrane dipeptidase
VTIKRREVLFGLVGATLFSRASDAAPAGAAAQDRIDTLCYKFEDLRPETVRAVIDGGMTAVVLDIYALPREPDTALTELEKWGARWENPRLRVHCVRKAADFEAARHDGRLGIVLACQDASILGSGMSDWDGRLKRYYELGLRVLQLTHNLRTPFGDSFMEPLDGGLSLAGRSLVERMNQLGMLVDLSHCSRRTLLEAADQSQKPCIVSHAGCKALAPTARNKSDEEIVAIGRRGGYFGIFGLTTWLTAGETASQATVLDHIDHAVQLIGPDKVGFGSDGELDTTNWIAEQNRMSQVQRANAGGPSAEWPVRHVRVPKLAGPDRMLRLAEALGRRGYKDDEVAGIVGGNFRRIFQQTCG